MLDKAGAVTIIDYLGMQSKKQQKHAFNAVRQAYTSKHEKPKEKPKK